MPVATLNMVRIDRRTREPLQTQLYRQIRSAIFSGELPTAIRLPSTRDVANQFRVSRNTVVYTFERLIAEGYLESTPGSGTYVARLNVGKSGQSSGAKPEDVHKNIGMSRRAVAIAQVRVSPYYLASKLRPFRPCQPALDRFPLRTWSRARSHALRFQSKDLMFWSEPSGLPRLRRALSVYLREARGVRCETDQIVITAGSQQALSLLAATLLNPGDAVWIEDPGYLGARAAMVQAGARLVPIPSDAQGITIPNSSRLHLPKVIYTMPSRQFPLGTTMSLSRRLALLEFARTSGAWVVEDDYDSEFRYTGRPVPSLQGMNENNCVIYIGSFSKVLFGSLRLGYIVVPDRLIDVICKAKEISDGSCPAIDQATTAVFIEEGYFSTHLRRMRRLYQERRDSFLYEARRRLSGFLTFPSIDAGMDATGWLALGTDDEAVSQRMAAGGVDAPPISAYCMGKYDPGLVFGFTAFNPAETRSAVLAVERSVTSERKPDMKG